MRTAVFVSILLLSFTFSAFGQTPEPSVRAQLIEEATSILENDGKFFGVTIHRNVEGKFVVESVFAGFPEVTSIEAIPIFDDGELKYPVTSISAMNVFDSKRVEAPTMILPFVDGLIGFKTRLRFKDKNGPTLTLAVSESPSTGKITSK